MLVRNVLIFGASAILAAGVAMAQGSEQSQGQSQSSSQTASQSSQQQSQTQTQSQSQTTDSTSSSAQSTSEQQPVSLGDAARKARQENKNVHATKTFTNDDLGAIRSGGISEVGQQGGAGEIEQSKTDGATKPTDQTKDEAYWRKRFADLRSKIATTQSELDVLQRELNLLQREYYPDPQVALQQQHSREDINKKTDEISAKQKQLDDLNQQLSDLQDQLRQAGGDPAWGR